MTPLDFLKMDAKDAQHRRYIEGLLRNKTSLNSTECISLYSATRHYSGRSVSTWDVQQQNLSEDAVLRRNAIEYVKKVGLKVS